MRDSSEWVRASKGRLAHYSEFDSDEARETVAELIAEYRSAESSDCESEWKLSECKWQSL